MCVSFTRNYALPYNATLLDAIRYVFKLVIGNRKINVLKLIIKLLLHITRHIILNQGCSTHLQLKPFRYLISRYGRQLQKFVISSHNNRSHMIVIAHDPLSRSYKQTRNPEFQLYLFMRYFNVPGLYFATGSGYEFHATLQPYTEEPQNEKYIFLLIKLCSSQRY